MINKIGKMLKNRKGFTLVELMVVVVIIGILAAVAVPMYSSVTANAELRACQANIRTIEGAAVQWVASAPAGTTRTIAELNESPMTATNPMITVTLTSLPKEPSGGGYNLVNGVASCTATTPHAHP